ncbi:PucR family transcriptional regulator [Catenulispora pinisilvae]|uniref:PucR family transcriptional regulator n=1 Tax=Catenulispora pinisilvae TaxID=2705253 RepID=UPI001891638B|nr:helix-turn-helix domain-containing protein [Catenulispora pinisilvae]
MESGSSRPANGDQRMAELTTLAGLMLARADDITDTVMTRVFEQFPVYAGMVSRQMLRDSVHDHVVSAFDPMARSQKADLRAAGPTGRIGAADGIPLTVFMDGYRVAFRVVWSAIVETARDMGMSADACLDAATILIASLDAFTREMSTGYRDELGRQIRSEEQRRSAVVQALLEGRLADTNVWEAAELLRLPASGPFVVIAARVPEVGRHALPQIEQGLGVLGIDSAWRLMHDVEIGVAALPGSGAQLDRLVTALYAGGGSRVGVSPPYDDLRSTSLALRLARIALHGAAERRRVVVFGNDPLSAVAGSAPDIMPRVARGILAGLDGLPAQDRMLLLDTFGAWLDADGSAGEAGRRMFVHPNTVRNRLRRLEKQTGRSLSNPRAIAELILAYEIDCGTRTALAEAAAAGSRSGSA